jgi:hypothetical protein
MTLSVFQSCVLFYLFFGFFGLCVVCYRCDLGKNKNEEFFKVLSVILCLVSLKDVKTCALQYLL